jgi:hypothetical protein
MAYAPNPLVTFLTKLPPNSILRTLNIQRLSDFKQLIIDRVNNERRNTGKIISYNTAGALILQGLILKKLRSIPPERYEGPDGALTLTNRLMYFKSAQFQYNFTVQLSIREDADDSAYDTSYTDWFNTLFSVSFAKWRDQRLITSTNQTQCSRALRGNTGTICYLCGDSLVKPHVETKECEHILPVISALSHLWLTKEKLEYYSPEEMKALELEYSWSHQCCNRIKSNYEFIKLNFPMKQYTINQDTIDDYYQNLEDSDDKYDCNYINVSTIPDIIKDNLSERLTNITRIINRNIGQFDDLDLYHLFAKFKVLSAFSEQAFLDSISGLDGSAAIPVYSRDPVKIARTKAENKRKEREAREFEQKKIVADREKAARARANRARRNGFGIRPLVGGRRINNEVVVVNDTDDMIVVENELNTSNSFYTFTPFDDTLTFPRSFLTLIGVPENIITNADTEGIPSIDLYIINYILMNDAYNPTEYEIDRFLKEAGYSSSATSKTMLPFQRYGLTGARPETGIRKSYNGVLHLPGSKHLVSKRGPRQVHVAQIHGGRRTTKKAKKSKRKTRR